VEGSDNIQDTYEGQDTPDALVDDAYPPDEDADESAVPVPKAAGIRQRAMSRGMVKRPAGAVARPTQTRLLAAEKRRKALELRKGGATYLAIANAVGYADAAGARKAVVRAMAELIQEPAAEVKSLQIERLNHMLLTLWPKVQSGDERSIETSLRVMDKLDRLMGTEAAQSVDINIHQQGAILVIDGNKDDYIASMKRMVGIASDGSNQDQKAITTGTAQMDGGGSGDIIDAELVGDEDVSLADALGEQGRDTIKRLMSPPEDQ
jgi:hypothetical protein